ncbi:MAG: nucleotidyltransferase domain-containing protein [Defluviitaleaceae bacterium]|nr:nucleotidyltransferase domain-containing protein [Defluviitaleaceae bacterium]
MFGLRQSDIDIIQKIGRDNPKIMRIFVYGSRSRGNYRKGSDVDLAFVGEVSSRDIAWISSELNEELPTPYFYDVVHYDTIADEDFKRRVAEEGKVVYERI